MDQQKEDEIAHMTHIFWRNHHLMQIVWCEMGNMREIRSRKIS